MYEIVMSTEDRAEVETVEAALTAARTMAEDASWEAYVVAAKIDERPFPFLIPVLNRHINEVRP
jgi:hypothetical protein